MQGRPTTKRRVALACMVVASAFAGCLSFGDLSGGAGADDSGISTAETSTPDGALSDAPISQIDGGSDGDAAVDANCSNDAAFGAPIRLSALSSADADWSPRLSPDELQLYFGSTRPPREDSGVAGIFVAVRADATANFVTASLLPGINGTYYANHPSPTADGLSLYMETNSSGNNDIFVTNRANTSIFFNAPMAVSGVNTADNEETPFIRADGTVLYFGRSSAGGLKQIMRATSTGGTFVASTESELNSPSYNVTYPVVTPDDLVIFFSSDDPSGAAGSYDIWEADRASTTVKFTNSHPVAELNSALIDSPSWISADRCTLYFSSSRIGGAGSLDLYYAVRTK